MISLAYLVEVVNIPRGGWEKIATSKSHMHVTCKDKSVFPFDNVLQIKRRKIVDLAFKC